MAAQITVAIPTSERVDLLDRAIESILNQTVRDIDIVVVDNSRDADTRNRLGRQVPAVRVIRTARSTFFAGAMNTALRDAATPFVAVLNDDAFLNPRWAEEALLTFARDDSVGSVATKVMNATRPDIIDSTGDQLDLAGRATNRGWGEVDRGQYSSESHVFSAAGSCAIYRRCAFVEAGGFDDAFVAYLEDVDLGFRLQLLGYRCVFNPACEAHHVGGATKKPRLYALWLTERNMVWNIVKNMPTSVIRRNLKLLARHQSKPAPVVGGASWRAWASGKAAAWVAPADLWAKRKRVQETRQVPDAHIESLLRVAEIRACHL